MDLSLNISIPPIPASRAASFREGATAQSIFTASAQAAGLTVIQAAQETDYLSHIDLWIKDGERARGVDVKGTKRLNRWGVRQDEYVCLELHGADANRRGWLYDGRADFIAFELADAFMVVWRDRLAAVPDFVVSNELVGRSSDAIYKIYSRRDHEQITWIEAKLLVNPWLLWKEIKKVQPE